jgi:aurora kinase
MTTVAPAAPSSRPASPVPAGGNANSPSPGAAAATGAATAAATSNAVVVPPGHTLHRGLIVVPPEPRTKWTIDDFEILHQLGGGQYGRVSLAAVKGSNYIVALKRLDLEHMAGLGVAVQLRREVEIAFNARHRHVLRTFGYFYDQTTVTLILEACANGMLFSKLHRVGRFDAPTAARYVAQLGEALVYLHKHHVLHRDIKPENILLDHNNDIKLADFGWSVHDPKLRRKTTCGTPEYFPPEVIHHTPYDVTADLWCLGIFCFELLVGHTPFADKDQKQIYQKIVKGTFEMPECVPPDARDLILSLLTQNPANRPSLRRVLAHEFLVKNYYSHLPKAVRRERE